MTTARTSWSSTAPSARSGQCSWHVEGHIVSVSAVVTDVIIRDAFEADADAISVIGKKAMPAQYAGLVDPAATEAAVEQSYAPSAVAECITRCHEATDAVFVVAERTGQVIGYLHFDSFGPEPELHRLYLDDSERGGGVGALLMDALHARIGMDADYMLLVVEGDEGAVRFYERWGFTSRALSTVLATTRNGWASGFPQGCNPSGSFSCAGSGSRCLPRSLSPRGSSAKGAMRLSRGYSP